MSGGKKQLLWQRMVAEGLAADRTDAERLVLLRKVYVGDTPATSAGQKTDRESALSLRGIAPFAGKGGLKLTGALDRMALDVTGRVAIDAGASTGGFTDALLQRGCARVYAVDVGYGQLTGRLRGDARVVNLERTNISDPTLLELTPRPTLGPIDLSYLSLRKGIPVFAQILHGVGDLVCLVKPLFEIDDAQARRQGVIDADAYVPLLEALCRDLAAGGFPTGGCCASPVTGNSGTLEFFLHVPLEGSPLPPDALRQQIARSVEEALHLAPYKKEC